jgi:acyl carrier protein phosphodiesterase
MVVAAKSFQMATFQMRNYPVNSWVCTKNTTTNIQNPLSKMNSRRSRKQFVKQSVGVAVRRGEQIAAAAAAAAEEKATQAQ